MPGQTSFVARCAAALAILLAPAAARGATPTHVSNDEAHPAGADAHAPPCGKSPVEVIAGSESAKLSLPRCDAELSPLVLDQLSILSRPATAPRPTEPVEVLSRQKGVEIAPGVRRLDGRLVDRLRRVVDHFAKDGETTRVDLVSGFRPRGSGSFHSAGRALDFRIEGVKNEAVVAFCKTLPDTGCGYYPNNVFVHMDVRDHGTGHVAWVDTSAAPAEAPRESAHVSASPAATPEAADVTPPAAHPAAAALGLSLAVPVEAAAPAPELPVLPKAAASPAHPEHAAPEHEKVSRAHHARKGRARHHSI
jgi:hypothetical protein